MNSVTVTMDPQSDIPPQVSQPSVKFSRYRSVRRAATANDLRNSSSHAHTSSIAPPPLPNDAETDPSTEKARIESLTRSRSRYRHPKHGTSNLINSAPPLPL